MSGRRPPTRRPSCGTQRGYGVHYRANEEACEDCLGELRDRQAARRAALPPEVREENRARKNATSAALAMVGRRSPDTYTQLLAMEKEVLLRPYAGQALMPDRRFNARIYDLARARTLMRMAAQDPDVYEACLQEAFRARGISP